jgi:transposase
MVTYAGLDVSLETVAICVLDGAGNGRWRGKCAAEPEVIAALLATKAPGLARVTLETGALAGWLYRELRQRDVPVVCVDARHAKAVLMQRLNKTDAIDAQGLAELARVGWFKEVQPKSEPAQLVATLIAARARLIKMRADLVNQIRGLLKPFGLRPGKLHGAKLAARVRELVADRGLLEEVIERLLQLGDDLQRQIVALHRRLLAITHEDTACRRLLTIVASGNDPVPQGTDRVTTRSVGPGVGPVTALAFRAAVDWPDRFQNARAIGAWLGLTPRRQQSGQTDRQGRISKRGDPLLRSYLFEAAMILLYRHQRASSLRSWGLGLAKRLGRKRAVTAVARKLAVVMLRLLKDATGFHPRPEAIV